MKLLLEQFGVETVAKNLVQAYKLNSKIKIKKGYELKADYNPETDVVTIAPTTYLRDFLLTILHEIHHAKMRKKMGKNKYVLNYDIEMNRVAAFSEYPYRDNRYEKMAEKWAHTEAPKWMKKWAKRGLKN